MNQKEIDYLRRSSVLYINECARKKDIYHWMDQHGVGESDYGAWLDALGRKEHVFHHRLFGHHPIYDFPLSDPDKISDFVEHVYISDAFTKQGLPIIPGDFLKDAGIIHYCSNKTLDWNFVNGFDLLSGTLSIYAGYKNCKVFFRDEASVDSFEDVAKQAGIGLIELAMALSKANPLLFLGACLQLAGTIRGITNDSSKAYFKKINSKYYLFIAEPMVSLDEYVKQYYMNDSDSIIKLNKKVSLYYLK